MGSMAQNIAASTVEAVAKREGWDPARPLAAIAAADPEGWDYTASPRQWWAAIYVALRPFETWPGMGRVLAAAKDGSLNAEKMGVGEIIAGTVRGSIQDVGDAVTSAAETADEGLKIAKSPIGIIAGILAIGGALWLAKK